MTDNGYDRRTQDADGWHVEGRRNGGPGSDWTVNAVHLPTGQSWLSLHAHSFDAGRDECVRAIQEQGKRTARTAAATVAGRPVPLTKAPAIDWKPVNAG